MAGCTINAHVRNSKGEVVESKLWKDLLSFTSKDRKVTGKYYAIGTDEKFLSLAKEENSYAEDENGQITFNALRKITKMNLSEEKLINGLNKALGAGKMPFNEAIQKLTNFNQNSEYKDEFMATLSYDDNNMVNLHIVKNSRENVEELREVLKNTNLQDRLISLLAQNGISVKFLENAEYQGRYSTQNAKKNAEGLYDLIEVVAGNKSVETLTEETGHAILGMLEDSPLSQRLLDTLTPEMQKSLIQKYGLEDHNMGADQQRELAGYLIGRAVSNRGNDSGFANLISRIWTQAKQFISKLKGDDVSASIYKAELYADSIAEGFYNSSLNTSIDKAIGVEETHFSAVESDIKINYHKTLKRMKESVVKLKYVDSELSKALSKSLQEARKVGNESDKSAGNQADIIALAGLFTAIQAFNEQFASCGDELIDLNFATSTFTEKAKDAGRIIRNARNFVVNGKLIYDELNIMLNNGTIDALTSDPEHFKVTLPDGTDVSLDLKAIMRDLKFLLVGDESFTGLVPLLTVKERKFFTEFLSSVYGKRFVTKSATLLFKGIHLIKQKAAKQFFDGENGLINYLETDISLFERFIGSMCNSEDRVLQIMDLAMKQGQHLINSTMLDMDAELKSLRKEMLSKLGHTDTSIFYEKDKDGNLTGNFISDVYTGSWELDYEKFVKDLNKRFKEQYKLRLPNMTSYEKGMLYHDFRRKEEKKWHKGYTDSVTGEKVPGHSVWDNNKRKYVPSTSSSLNGRDYVNYTNLNFKILSAEELEILDKFKAIKNRIDEALPKGSVMENRLPQFKGRFSHKFKNRREKYGKVESFRKTIGAEILDTFCEDSDDSEYGSMLTYNSMEEEPFGDELLVEQDKLERVPLFGINRLKNLDDLSTDLFDTMLAYAYMGTNYATMNNLVDGFEIGRQVLWDRTTNRKTQGVTERVKDEGQSRAFKRFEKYISKNLYNVAQPKVKLWNVVLNKVAQAASGLASKVFLGGNVQGGLVNAGTGAIEVFKEALAGEHYSVSSWYKANKIYNDSVIPMILNGFTNNFQDNADEKVTKLTMLLRRWNVMDSQSEYYRNANMNENHLWGFIKNESLFTPYKIGEHYMQSIAFLATALEQDLRDLNGNKVELFDAYDLVTIPGVNGPVTSLKIKDKYYKSGDSMKLHKAVQSYIEELEQYYDDPVNNAYPIASSEVKNWLDEQQRVVPTNKRETEFLKQFFESTEEDFFWNMEKVEATFIAKAREINNRMHGVYNKIDKTALHQNIVGNMWLSMKGYALGLIERRFATSKESAVLDHSVEGSYVSGLKFIMQQIMSIDDWKSFWVSSGNIIHGVFLPFSLGKNDKFKTTLIQQGFSENQIANLKRNLGDGLFVVALMILAGLTAKPKAPEPPEEIKDIEDWDTKDLREFIDANGLPIEFRNEEGRMKQASSLRKEIREYYAQLQEDQELMDPLVEGILHYFTQRLYREQAAFTPWMPHAMFSEYDSLTETVPSGISVLIDLCKLAYLGYGAMTVDPEEAKEMGDTTFYYSSTKEGMYEKWKDSKFKVKFQKLFPYWRSWYLMQHPYDAAKNYEFGNRVIVK